MSDVAVQNDAAGGLSPEAGPPLPERYEQALGELEALVEAMESGRLSLDALLTQYRRGAALLAHCRGQLEAVQQQVRILEGSMLVDWRDEGREGGA